MRLANKLIRTKKKKSFLFFIRSNEKKPSRNETKQNLHEKKEIKRISIQRKASEKKNLFYLIRATTEREVENERKTREKTVRNERRLQDRQTRQMRTDDTLHLPISIQMVGRTEQHTDEKQKKKEPKKKDEETTRNESILNKNLQRKKRTRKI